MRNFLLDLETSESEIGRKTAALHQTHSFQQVLAELFSDTTLPAHFAFRRNAAPLGILTVLYPKTSIYVPPVTKSDLEARLGLTLHELIELWDAGIVIPVIGHPAYYAERNDLSDLLSRRPISAWARFDAAASQFGRDDLIEKALSSLRAESLDLEWARSKWSRQFPHLDDATLTQQIFREIANNYANLAVMGLSDVADTILRESRHAAALLVATNEIFTYPRVIGLGGTPSYDDTTIHSQPIIQSLQAKKLNERQALEHGAGELMRGLRLSVPQRIDTDSIIRLHVTGEVRQVWKLHEEISALARSRGAGDAAGLANEYGSVVREMVSKVNSIPHDKRRVNAIMRWISFGLGVGGGAAAYLATSTSGLWVGLAAASAIGSIPPFFADHFGEAVANIVLRLKHEKLELNFWEIKDRTGRNR